MKKFYDDQDILTAAKIEFYQSYIQEYLVKILIRFNECFIADLFCGTGKNGDKNGSPLVLLDRIQYLFKEPKLKDTKVYILFNDKDKNNANTLEKELKKINKNENVYISSIQSKKFEDILPMIVEEFKKKFIPKFFFLDSFTYSNVKMNHLKEIMSLRNAEILLFLPVFFGYRFSSDKKLTIDHKTRVFIEEFTTKGVCDYRDIHDFMESIKEKLKRELNLNFVRPVLLNGGTRKNSLFLLTKHDAGMLLMNKLCIKKSRDGSGINIKENYENKIFLNDKKEILKLSLRYKNFKNNLINQLQNKKEMTTNEIKMFTIISEFRPQDASNILKDLKKDGEIKCFDVKGKETRRFYMGENPKGSSVFRYIS